MRWSSSPLLILCALVAIPLGTATEQPLLAADPASSAPALPHPLGDAHAVARDVAHLAAPLDPHGALRLGARLAGIPATDVDAATHAAARTSTSLDDAYQELLAALDLANPDEPLSATFPAALEPALIRLLDAVTAASHLRHDAIAALSPEEQQQLHRLDQSYRTSRTNQDRDILSAVVTSQGGLPATFDRAAILAGAHLMSEAALDAAALIEDLRDGPDWPAITAALDACTTDPVGVIVVCGPGDDTVSGTYALELDLGGHDVHATNAGSSGLALLFPGPNGLPAALALDLMGDDTYTATAQAQGTGSTSPGVLIDLAGNDRYIASGRFFTFAQGAGHLGGVGLLHDALGDDQYIAYTSAWDTQGFGILGGIGILVDPVGNERYRGDVMSAGVGDFNAVGLLVDGAGWDDHRAGRWAQGFADGGAAGLLWDAEGNDAYQAGTQAQGAGLGGSGVLLDASGNDVYRASGQTQGWGSDGPAWAPVNSVLAALGLGLPGTGALIDGAGGDTYTGNGCNQCTWTGGRSGVGVDGL